MPSSPLRSVRAGEATLPGRIASKAFDDSDTRPGKRKANYCKGRWLIRLTTADQVHVRTKRRPRQQGSDRELADHDREGQEGAAEERYTDVRQDDPEQN